MLIYSSVTSCVPCVLMKSAVVNHDISYLYMAPNIVPFFPGIRLPFAHASSDKISHQTWIYNLDDAGPPPTPFHLRYGFRYSLPPRFVRPLPSAHHRSLMTRRSYYSVPSVSSILIPTRVRSGNISPSPWHSRPPNFASVLISLFPCLVS